MVYEKPRRSAGLIIAGVLSLIAAYLLRWIGSATDQPAGGIGVIVAVIGVGCLVAGLWRFLSAVDDAVLHRWQTVVAARNDHTATASEERGRRTGEDTRG